MGSSGITIPNPIRSMKTVRRRTTSGERCDAAGSGTARGNRKGPDQSRFAVEPPEPPDDLTGLDEERGAEPRHVGREIAVPERAQRARELAHTFAARTGTGPRESLGVPEALLDHAQREVERATVAERGAR